MKILGISTGVEDFTLEQAFALLADLYGRVDEHAARIAAPLELLCHPGCSACCRQSVFVTTLEALYLLHHARTHFPEDQFRRAIGGAVATFEQHRERILSFGHAECPGAAPLAPDDERPRTRPVDRVLAARALQFDCPLLDGAGMCTVYPARELRGRLFAVSRLKSRDEYYACDLLGRHLDGREVTLMDAEAVSGLMHLYPLTRTEQVIPYFAWRYASVLLEGAPAR